MPRFSVIIPTYNRAVALRKTVLSVLAQTFQDFEVLVVDDGSTDGTATVVAELGDPRVRYFWNRNSGGPAVPRNQGIDVATGEWICFLDSDDLWHPDKLEAIDRVIAGNPDVDAIGNNELVRDWATGGMKVIKYGPATEDFYRTLLVEGNRCSTSAMSVRRSFIDAHVLRFDTSPDYVIVEDYDFWMRLAMCGARFRFIDRPLGEYVLGDANISGNTDKSRRNLLTLLEHHVMHLQQFEANRAKLWREIRARAAASNAVADLRQKRPVSCMKNAALAILTSPSGVARWLRHRLRKRTASSSMHGEDGF